MLDIPIKDYFRETRLFNSRLSIAVVVVSLLTFALIARLVYLQIINHRHYVTLSQENRIHPRPIPPVRGRVFDRHGAVLAENRPVFTWTRGDAALPTPFDVYGRKSAWRNSYAG